jgi:glycosyltransferase involved in cell wall biosynthesis
VAIAQTAELARLGHDVHFFAGWDGLALLEIPGVTVKLFRTRRVLPGGFSGLISPALLRHLKTSGHYDAVHVHLSRDLVTAPSARLAIRLGFKLVTQTHGMVMPDIRIKSRIFDRVWTRAVLTHASARLALTHAERSGVRQVVGNDATVELIANGIQSHAPVGRVVATTPPEVIFLARLHPRKRVMTFARSVRQLVRTGVLANFRVIGPDEGDLSELLAFIQSEDLTDNLAYEGTISSGAAPGRLSGAAVYVLPSFGEIFPMTVLEALSVGTPVVLTEDCGISPLLKSLDAAVVVSGSEQSLTEAIAHLLTDFTRADQLAANGLAAIQSVFSIGAVARELEAIYFRGTEVAQAPTRIQHLT